MGNGRMFFSRVMLGLSLLALNAGALAEFDRARIVRLATTTSTENSGLLDELLPRFEAASGYRVHIIAVGTGKALRMGRDGDVDLVLVHAPAAEQRFVDRGFGEQRLPVMFNDFVLVGPHADPADLAQAANAVDALTRIAASRTPFVSRGDDSGTHKKELSLWKQGDLIPAGGWYREAGQGMGKVLQMADEMNAYTLIDRGTWLAYREQSRLKVIFEGDEELNHRGAQALIGWIRGTEGQQAIAAYRKSGEQLFTPAAGIVANR